MVLESVVSLVLKAFKSTNSLDISALRGMRVLRPLRAITYIKQVGGFIFSGSFRSAGVVLGFYRLKIFPAKQSCSYKRGNAKLGFSQPLAHPDHSRDGQRLLRDVR